MPVIIIINWWEWILRYLRASHLISPVLTVYEQSSLQVYWVFMCDEGQLQHDLFEDCTIGNENSLLA